jgi:hypothetical protein
VIWLFFLSFAVTGLAWVIASRRLEHRPVAWFLTVSLIADIIRWPLSAHVLRTGHQRFDPAPFSGWYRVACHLDDALFLVWPAGITALAMVVFLGRRPWVVLAAWALTVAAIAIMYPVTRGYVLSLCYLAAEIAALTATIGFYAVWWRRREPPTLQNVCTLLIFCAEIATLIGPYSGNIFTTWDLAQASFATLYVTLFVIQGGALWASFSPSRSR